MASDDHVIPHAAELTAHRDAPAPPGWRWGVHVDNASRGREGWYLYEEESERVVLVWARQDGAVPTPQAMLEAVEAALAEATARA